MIRYLLLFSVTAFIMACPPAGASSRQAGPNMPVGLYAKLGTAFSPAHFPHPNPTDVKAFFDLAASIGSNVTLITEWKDRLALADIRGIGQEVHARRMQFHLFLSPIQLAGNRDAAAVPSSVKGSSFADPQVRKAFIAKVLEFASVKPDVLGLGTEVNLLAGNAKEFENYVSLVREASFAIKHEYPSQIITVSFQWDKMLTTKDFAPLFPFTGCIDIYTFTSYPVFFEDPDRLPGDYYSSIRKVLPAGRLGFSEIGWNSAAGGTEDKQAQFYAKLPELMAGTRSEFVTLGLMHDVTLFSGAQSFLNSVGVRNQDGTPKKSWEVIEQLQFK